MLKLPFPNFRTMGKTYDVFISYSSKDNLPAELVCRALEEAGVPCWIAPRDVTPGLRWGECIIRALDSCPVMVLLLTRNSIISKHVAKEVERAIHKEVVVIPLRLENVFPDANLEFFLSDTHWMDAHTGPVEGHLARLAEVVKSALEHLPRRSGEAPTDSGVREGFVRALDATLSDTTWRLSAAPTAAAPPEGNVLTIPAPFLTVHEPAHVLHLAPPLAAASDGSPVGWRLCSGSTQMLLGRSTQNADIITRFLPATAENNSLSSTLSRTHAILKMSEIDGAISVTAAAEPCLVTVDSQVVAAGAYTPFPEGATLSLGKPPVSYRLAWKRRDAWVPNEFSIANETAWAGHRLAPQPELKANWGQIGFEYFNGGPACWQTHWLHRHLPFGNGSGAGFKIAGLGLEEVHGYFHHYRGMYWMEVTSRETGVVKVNGHPLAKGEIVPLLNGASVKFGPLELTATKVR